MTASTAPTAVTNLLAAISTQSAVTTSTGYAMGVLRGAPLEDQPLDEAIVIRQVQRTVQRFEMSGIAPVRGALREDYVIPVEVFVWRGGDDALSVETRAWALIAAVEAAVMADRTLAGAVIDAWPEASQLVSEWDDTSSGRRAIASVDVHCWSTN
jgi:hypothetical protein